MTIDPNGYYRKASGLRIAATAAMTIVVFITVLFAVMYLLFSGSDYDARCRATESHPCEVR